MTLRAATSVFGHLRGRARFGITVEALACLAAAGLAFVAFSYPADRLLRLETAWRLLPLVLLGTAVVWIVATRLVRPLAVELSDDELALACERSIPSLHERLISALQFDLALSSRAAATPGTAAAVVESPQMMERVVTETEAEVRGLPVHRALDGGRVGRFALLGAACVAAVAGFALAAPAEFGLWARRNVLLADEAWPRRTRLEFVPGTGPDGSFRVAERDDLAVQVHAAGVIPDEVRLWVRFASGDSLRVPMERIADDGPSEIDGRVTFSAVLETLLEPAELEARGGDGLAGPLAIVLIERPRLSDVGVVVTPPDYLDLPPTPVDAGSGAVDVPAGGRLTLHAEASKSISGAVAAWDGRPLDPDAVTVAGETRQELSIRLAPGSDGILEVDVLDTDRLGTAAPLRLSVHVVPDESPRIDVGVRGIGSLVTTRARIPLEVLARDDHGVRRLEAAWSLEIVDAAQAVAAPAADPDGGAGAGNAPTDPAAGAAAGPAAVDWTDATAEGPDGPALSGLDAFTPGAVEFAGDAVFDLDALNPDPDELSPANPIRPGSLLSVRLRAVDGRRPEPQSTDSEPIRLRVVTRAQLAEEFARRRAEQRRELEQVLERERSSRSALAEIVSPRDPELGAEARTRIDALLRQQRTLAERVQGVAERYDQILAETLNNRMLEPGAIARTRREVVDRLTLVVDDAFPRSVAAGEDFVASGAESDRTDLLQGYDRVIAQLESVLARMERQDSIASIVQGLRDLLRKQDRSAELVEKKRDALGEAIFGGK